MMNFKRIPLLLLSVLLCSTLHSQQKWSLAECIVYARENNLQVKQQMIAIGQAENNLLSAKMDYIPSLNASMSHNMSWGRSVNLNDLEIIENQLSQSTSLSLSASVPVFEGMRKHNTVKSNIKQLEIAGTNVEKLKDEISIAVAQAYLQVLLNKEIEKSALQSCQSVEKQVERCRELVEAGSQAYSSLLEIQAQLANERVQLVNAGNNVRSSLLNLAQMLDLENFEEFDIVIPDIEPLIAEPEETDMEKIYGNALSLPRIRGAELALEQSKLQYKIQKGAALPTISFNAGYGTYYSDNQQTAFFEQFNNNRNPSMGFGLSIPIFNNWRNNTAIRNARLNVKNSELELKIQHQGLMKDIQQACNDAKACYEKLNASQENLSAAKESFKYTEEKFNAGMVSGTDYTVAKTNLTKSESEYIQSKFQYVFQLKVLDYYRNIPLTL